MDLIIEAAGAAGVVAEQDTRHLVATLSSCVRSKSELVPGLASPRLPYRVDLYLGRLALGEYR